MKPLMYGYMRASDEVPDNELEHVVSEIQRFAETEGFCYATTCFEYPEGSRAAFEELVQGLQRAEARHVVVPTLEHLSSHRNLRASMVERLEVGANTHVLTPGSA